MASQMAKLVLVVALILSVRQVSDGVRMVTTTATAKGLKIERFTQCGVFNFTKESHYGTNRDVVIRELETNTLKSKGCKLSMQSSHPPLVFGNANCSTVLTQSSCMACLQEGADLLRDRCPTSLEGIAALGDCNLVYNSHP